MGEKGPALGSGRPTVAGKGERLKQVVVERIRSGVYPVGTRLPGVRSAAREFGVHANTVSRVYGELADAGLLRTVQGSGTFVVDVPGPAQARQALAELSAGLRALALQARRLGLSREDWARLVDEAEAEGFRAEGPTMWFVERAARDAEEFAARLCTLLERPVLPLPTTELPRRSGELGGPGQLLVTTPFQLEEVEALVGAEHEVVSVNVVPTTETLVRLARLRPDARVTIVASHAGALARFAAMVKTYTRREPAATAVIDDADAPGLVRRAEVLVVSRSAHERVAGWGPTGEVIAMRFQIEPTSIAYLREVLRRRAAGEGRGAKTDDVRGADADDVRGAGGEGEGG